MNKKPQEEEEDEAEEEKGPGKQEDTQEGREG